MSPSLSQSGLDFLLTRRPFVAFSLFCRYVFEFFIDFYTFAATLKAARLHKHLSIETKIGVT